MTTQQTMDALLDAYADRRRALRRVLWLIARHPDHIAADPSFVIKALDAQTAIGVCPPGCTGDCTPDPAVIARYHQI